MIKAILTFTIAMALYDVAKAFVFAIVTIRIQTIDQVTLEFEDNMRCFGKHRHRRRKWFIFIIKSYRKQFLMKESFTEWNGSEDIN